MIVTQVKVGKLSGTPFRYWHRWLWSFVKVAARWAGFARYYEYSDGVLVRAWWGRKGEF